MSEVIRSHGEKGDGRRQAGLRIGVLAAGVSLAAGSLAASPAGASPLDDSAISDLGSARGLGSPCRVAQDVAAPQVRVRVHDVQGKFWCSQDVVTPTEQIVRDLKGASAVLCDDGRVPDSYGDSLRLVSSLDWPLRIDGAVATPVSTTLGELADDGVVDAVMSYTCLDNPADGRATANAATTGVTVASILARAGLAEGANVVTFVSADGYQMSLPLDYVLGRTSLIAYRLNGESLKDALGCSNQLWLGGAPANCFVRDVLRIHVDAVPASELPPVPGSPQAKGTYANRPNIGVLRGVSA